MAEISTLNIEELKINNESTPPNKVIDLSLPKIWMKKSASVRMNIAEITLDEVVDMNENNKARNGIENIEELKDKFESFSVSSNGYTSNSCLNDSSIMNATIDDEPHSSTPEHSRPVNAKYKMYRPPDLVLEEPIDKEQQNNYLDLDQYSPVRSPYPANSSNDSLFGHETPQPICYDTPPKGSQMNDKDMKMVHLLTRFGLSHLAFIFIEQEVDIGLFLTLNDEDLKEIGIRRNTDRNVILAVIEECNNRLFGYRYDKSA